MAKKKLEAEDSKMETPEEPEYLTLAGIVCAMLAEDKAPESVRVFIEAHVAELTYKEQFSLLQSLNQCLARVRSGLGRVEEFRPCQK